MSRDSGCPDFVGKTVAFYGIESKIISVIVSPRVEEQVGRVFVVGEPATSHGYWAEGARAAIAWGAVRSYIALDNDAWVSRRATETDIRARLGNFGEDNGVSRRAGAAPA